MYFFHEWNDCFSLRDILYLMSKYIRIKYKISHKLLDFDWLLTWFFDNSTLIFLYAEYFYKQS